MNAAGAEGEAAMKREPSNHPNPNGSDLPSSRLARRIGWSRRFGSRVSDRVGHAGPADPGELPGELPATKPCDGRRLQPTKAGPL